MEKETKVERKTYTKEEKVALMKEYFESAETRKAFFERTGMKRRTMYMWLEQLGIGKDGVLTTKSESMTQEEENIETLKAEIKRLKLEKRDLANQLEDEQLKREACEMMIDLAESTFHIKIKKNSGAK
jgi:transposase